MSLTKEECEDCVSVFTDKICLSCPNEHCTVNCEVSKSENQLYQLIDEHFDNPPLKFEELKPNMWVWDNKIERFIKIIKVDYDQDYFIIDADVFIDKDWTDEIWYEENRFYRKQVEE